MDKISYRLVYNRKNHLNGKGEALIQIEAYFQKKKIYFSSHIYVSPQQWDAKKQCIIGHPHSENLNRMLEEFILSLQCQELKFWKEGKGISLDLLRQPRKVSGSPATPFYLLGRKWVEQSNRKESTKKNLYSTLSFLKNFSPQLSVQGLSYAFVKDFEAYLMENGLSVNTIAKHLCQLRTLINEAIKQGLLPMDKNPFFKYKVRTTSSKHSFLLPEELVRLENLTLASKRRHLQHTLDAFLFCCYTGLRYSDFTHLTSKNLVRLDKQHVWLCFRSVKTNVETQIPVYLLFQGKALQILRKYSKELDSFFRIKPNSHVNKELIILKKMAGIDKQLSFHTARHTNATLLIHEGVPITTVQKLLGHRSIKTTQGYSNVFPKTIVNDLKKCKTRQR